jgi:hypothetical protein
MQGVARQPVKEKLLRTPRIHLGHHRVLHVHRQAMSLDGGGDDLLIHEGRWAAGGSTA